MRILAFDQSSRITGYSIFDNDKLIAYDKFSCTDEDMGDRLVKIRQMLLGLIAIYNPDVVVFEDIQFQNNVVNNVDTFKKLAEVFGVFYETLTEMNIDYQIVPSVTWKSKLGIKGSKRTEQKNNAAAWVLEHYGVRPTQDECDAICIGAYVLNNSQQKKEFDWTM